MIEIEETRVPWDKEPPKGWVANGRDRLAFGSDVNKKTDNDEKVDANPNGRYPSNIIGEVMPADQSYFYAPRVTRQERGENNTHPTPKPINLMRYLIKMFCPKDGIVLDPFSGSGSTGIGALLENREYIGMDISEEYTEIARERLTTWEQYKDENTKNSLDFLL